MQKQIGWLNTGSGAIAIGDASYLANYFEQEEEAQARQNAREKNIGHTREPLIAALHFDQPREREQGIELVWSDGSLPDAYFPIVGIFEGDRLMQIFINLASLELHR